MQTASPVARVASEPVVQREGTGNPTGSAHATLTDDEILGLGERTRTTRPHRLRGTEPSDQEATKSTLDQADGFGPTDGEPLHDDIAGDPERLGETILSNPELQRAWQEAEAYRSVFATPEEARSAATLANDIRGLDRLFYSNRPEDHLELARNIAQLDGASFELFAKAIGRIMEENQGAPGKPVERVTEGLSSSPRDHRTEQLRQPTAPPGAVPNGHIEFVQRANAAVVRGTLDAIESQIDRSMPDGISPGGRNRLTGEIYRELDRALQSNGQFGRQAREAFSSGNLDSEHENAIVSLILGRARQALPSIAKRVMNEWTSSVLAASQQRRAKQKAAEGRVDIGGARSTASEVRTTRSPRDIDYTRMSDAEILNL